MPLAGSVANKEALPINDVGPRGPTPLQHFLFHRQYLLLNLSLHKGSGQCESQKRGGSAIKMKLLFLLTLLWLAVIQLRTDPSECWYALKKWNLSSILEHDENFDSYTTLQTLADICWFWRWKRCDNHYACRFKHPCTSDKVYLYLWSCRPIVTCLWIFPNLLYLFHISIW